LQSTLLFNNWMSIYVGGNAAFIRFKDACNVLVKLNPGRSKLHISWSAKITRQYTQITAILKSIKMKIFSVLFLALFLLFIFVDLTYGQRRPANRPSARTTARPTTTSSTPHPDPKHHSHKHPEYHRHIFKKRDADDFEEYQDDSI